MGMVHFKRFTHRGDGFVAARHLAIFGYRPTLYYPKKSRNEEDMKMMDMLLKQAIAFGVQTIDALPSAYFHLPDVRSREELAASYDLVVDAILGFSAHGACALLRHHHWRSQRVFSPRRVHRHSLRLGRGRGRHAQGRYLQRGYAHLPHRSEGLRPLLQGPVPLSGRSLVAPVVFTQFPIYLPPYSGCEL